MTLDEIKDRLDELGVDEARAIVSMGHLARSLMRDHQAGAKAFRRIGPVESSCVFELLETGESYKMTLVPLEEDDTDD